MNKKNFRNYLARFGINLNLKDYHISPFIRFIKSLNKRYLVGIEIGVEKGFNALDMLNSLSIKKLYLIDPYLDNPKHKKIVKKVLSKHNSKIEFIYKLSNDAKDIIKEKVDFIYIDGNHTYNYVKEDIENYYPLLKEDGIIGGHDYSFSPESNNLNYGVYQAVKEFFKVVYFQELDWWINKNGVVVD